MTSYEKSLSNDLIQLVLMSLELIHVALLSSRLSLLSLIIHINIS